MTSFKKYELVNSIVIREEDQVCFDSASGWLIHLNPTGYIVIKLLELKQYTLEEIATALSVKLEKETSTVYKDVDDFVKEFVIRSLAREIK